ncbi:CitMHS family transporter [Flavobacterium hercynium]|uniref:Citrate transporter n=1 Tax=Flavobacterium hercynium TaxID=387094 RepID=A0A226H5J6_9FLAO|nr:CitMHS family transporter [Flavobacterium hercynium]OXA88946.1 citrate transporter [Flavobacterium hercynium]SMP28424.1 citrate-Mg2+:H+ or citrate-Ca2+:H+ symporter, CitMHS family [Flavobacterium hercynium]
MLTILGFSMIMVFMYLIMTKRLFPLTALILIPILFAIFAGFTADLGSIIMDGVKNIAPTGIMLIFGILFFSIMIDAGLFDPLVNLILKFVKGDPVKIAVGTALLTILVSLDGDGATTYMIVVAAMLPLYKKLGMNPLVLACIIMLGGGVMNILPWGGPTARAMTTLKMDASELFMPMIPVMAGGIVWVIFTAFWLGLREKKRIAREGDFNKFLVKEEEAVIERELRRPGLIWFNLLLTILLLASMMFDVLPLAVSFMIAFCIGLIINYPKVDEQQKVLKLHAGNALSVASMIFAAGIFTGILSGTGMMDAMAASMISVVPDTWSSAFPVLTAVSSAPLTFFLSNDAYYFGILPLITETGIHLGATKLEIGAASLIGQGVHLLSPLVPSTYLLVGLAGVEFSDHVKFTMKWALGSSLAMLIAALLIGLITF